MQWNTPFKVAKIKIVSGGAPGPPQWKGDKPQTHIWIRLSNWSVASYLNFFSPSKFAIKFLENFDFGTVQYFDILEVEC